jgi:hypothetical protein
MVPAAAQPPAALVEAEDLASDSEIDEASGLALNLLAEEVPPKKQGGKKRQRGVDAEADAQSFRLCMAEEYASKAQLFKFTFFLSL